MKTAERITAETRAVASENTVGCDIDGEMVLLDLTSGIYFGLNPVGAEIWNFIREEKSVAETESHLLRQYDVPATRCASEVRSLLAQLAEKGLVRLQ